MKTQTAAAAGLTKSNSYAQLHMNKTTQQFSINRQQEITPQRTNRSTSKQHSQQSPFHHVEDTILKDSSILRQNCSYFQPSTNPITADGLQECIFRPSIKKTMYSDIDQIKCPLPPKVQRVTSNADFGHLKNQTESKQWKPSVKQIDQKDSNHYELFERRTLKSATSNATKTSSVNPLLGQDEQQLTRRSHLATGNGDQVISAQYQRIADRKEMRSVGTRNNWEQYTQSQIFNAPDPQPTQVAPLSQSRSNSKFSGDGAKSLLSYEYALPYSRVKDLTEKVGREKKDRFLAFSDANDCDFRKRSNRLEKEEVFAQHSQKQLHFNQTPGRTSSRQSLHNIAA